MLRTAVRTGSTCLLALSMALTLLVIGAPEADAALRPKAEVLMVKRINEAREARGLNRLVPNLQMKRIARQWTSHMISLNAVYHRPNLAAVVDGPYERLAENVGFTRLEGASDAELVNRLHRAFMASDGHRTQILGRFNMVGVGLHRLSGGRMFVTVNFLKGPRDAFPLYADADDNAHERAIGSLFVRGAVRGCDADSFCPRAGASRQYVANVVDRARKNRAANRWLDAQCGSNSSCRKADMSRVQMARMLTHVLGLQEQSGSRFTDVASSARGEVYAVVGAGYMGGCSYSRFCPAATVRRARVAGIVYRATR